MRFASASPNAISGRMTAVQPRCSQAVRRATSFGRSTPRYVGTCSPHTACTSCRTATATTTETTDSALPSNPTSPASGAITRLTAGSVTIPSSRLLRVMPSWHEVR